MSIWGNVIAKATVVTPEMFGAIGDGVADDTVPVQTAINRAASALYGPCSVQLKDGAHYSVTNLSVTTIPSGTTANYLSIFANGTAFIEGRAGGDSGYLAAPDRWLANSAFGNRRTIFRNIYFDAKNLKDYACVSCGDRWEFWDCQFYNAVSHGVLHANNTRDLSNPDTGSVDTLFERCEARSNGGDGINLDQWSVDYVLRNFRGTANTGYGINANNSAGAQIISPNCYGNTAGPARFVSWGWASFCTGGLFDAGSGGSVILSCGNPGPYAAFWGPGNSVKNGPLTCQSMPGGLILDSVYMQGATAQIVMDDNASSARRLQIKGGSSTSANPAVTWNSATPVGTVVADNFFVQATGGWLNGRVRPMPNTVTAGYAPTKMLPASKALAAGTTTTLVITVDLANVQNAGGTLDIDLTVTTLTAPSVYAYRGQLRAGITRRLSLTTVQQWCTTAYNDDGGAAVITAAGVWSSTPTTGAYTATLTITVTHPTPTAPNGTLCAEIKGVLYGVTGMTAT